MLAAVLPHPPMLVPSLTAGATRHTQPLLAACDAATADLVAELPETVVCVGAGERTAYHRSGSWGTLAGFGVTVEAPAQHHDGLPHLPLSLTIGRWLLDRVGWDGPVALHEVAASAEPQVCAALGVRLAQEYGDRAAWLVLGDGSSRRGDHAPGGNDERAPAFDAKVSAALADGDPVALAAIDAGLAAELGATGRSAWQVLAGAVRERRIARSVLRYDAAPFGVAYRVATWHLS